MHVSCFLVPLCSVRGQTQHIVHNPAGDRKHFPDHASLHVCAYIWKTIASSTTFNASIDAELTECTSDLSAPANGVRWTHLYTSHTAIASLTKNTFIILKRTPVLKKKSPSNLKPPAQPQVPAHKSISVFINLLKHADPMIQCVVCSGSLSVSGLISRSLLEMINTSFIFMAQEMSY